MAGSDDLFFPDFTAQESVGMFDQNAFPNYQGRGANGLNDLGAYQFEGWATINVGYDKDDGNPQFAVGPDGWRKGATQAATTSYTYGKTQDLMLSSSFGAGGHDVAVSLLDDAWGGTPSTDRNLYVNSIDDDGKRYVSATAELMTNGTVHFQVGVANGP